MWASNVSSACGTDFILLRFSNCDLFSHHASSSSSRSSSSSSSSTVSLLPSALCFPSEAGPASASSSTGGGGGGRGVLRVCGKRGKCLVVGNRRPHRILDYGGGTGVFRVFATADVEKSDAVVQPKLESVEVKEAVKFDRVSNEQTLFLYLFWLPLHFRICAVFVFSLNCCNFVREICNARRRICTDESSSFIRPVLHLWKIQKCDRHDALGSYCPRVLALEFF